VGRARLSPGWVVAALFVAGLLISGFTILRGIDPFDEGLMLQAARRTADGQWVYRDFLWSYGPGNILVLAGSFKLFGTSLLWWRIVRVVVDALVAVVVFLVLRREVDVRWALFGWLAAACAMAQPTSANPFPPALLFGLLAVAVAAGALGSGRVEPRVAAVGAGVLCALAAFWRPDFGGYAAAGVAVALVVRWGWRSLAPFAGATAAVAVLLYLPYAIAAGPGELLDSIVSRSLRDGSYWRLPFPIGYSGPLGSAQDAKDVLEFYVPLLLVIGLLVAAGFVVASWRRRALSPVLAGFATFGAGCLLYLLSRTDEFHATPLLVVLAVLLPLVAAGRSVRLLAGAAAAVLALLTLYGVSNRAAALVSPPEYATVHVPVADGVEAAPVDAAALPSVVRLVQSLVPAGRPIYVAPLRSDLVKINDPLLYVLTERPNVTNEDFGLLTSASAQRRIVATLVRTQPGAIVRWRDPISVEREPNRRGTPTGVRLLDGWIDSNYRLRRRVGYYDVLVPRL
jgi:hypothetical protein